MLEEEIRPDILDEEKPPYPYKSATLVAFKKLPATTGWSPADPPRNPQGMLEAIHKKTGLAFVLVPAGSFQMGSPSDEEGREPNEGPVYTVMVPAFLLCKTEYTECAWVKGKWEVDICFTGEDHPVDSVSWTQSRDLCAQNGLRLPSETEWEYSCRAGTTTKYSFGDDEARLPNHAWFFRNSGESLLPPGTPWDGGRVTGEWAGRHHPVGKKLPNPWGLFDMHGNVWECCEDTYHDSYEGAPTDGSAWTTEGSSRRVLRGGSLIVPAVGCRSAVRSGYKPHLNHPGNGFRLAADLPE